MRFLIRTIILLRTILVIGFAVTVLSAVATVSAFAQGRINSTPSQTTVQYQRVTTEYEAPRGGRVTASTATTQGRVKFNQPCPKGSERIGEKCVVSCSPDMYRYRGQCRCPDGLVREGNRCAEVAVIPDPPKCLLPKIMQDGACLLPPQIIVYPPNLPDGTEGKFYITKQFQARGGVAPHRYSIASGRLPAGLIVTPTGKLVGKPTQTGTFDFAVGATDSKQFTGMRTYQIKIKIPDKPPEECPAGFVRFGTQCVPSRAPPPPEEDPPETQTDLARPLQKALKRLGCLKGSVDGVWGRGSRSALDRFVDLSGLDHLDRRDPTPAALRAAKSKQRGYCKTKEGPTCRGDTYLEGGECVCDSGLVKQGSKCIKPRPKGLECRGDTYREGNRCVCDSGYKKRGTKCIKIGPKCRSNASPNGEGGCSCDDGYERRGNRCKRIRRCPSKSFRNDEGQCQCNDGYERRGNRCKKIRSCPSNSYRNDEGQCQCKDGYQPSGNRCKRMQRCPSNSYRNDEGQCQCNDGYQPSGNRCKRVTRSNPETNGGNSKRYQKCQTKCKLKAAGCMLIYNDENRCRPKYQRCLVKKGCP